MLILSNFKSTHTLKPPVGICPNGMGLIFSEIYPRSVCDSNIVEKSDLISWVETEPEIMSGKEFAIQNFGSIEPKFFRKLKFISEISIYRNNFS